MRSRFNKVFAFRKQPAAPIVKRILVDELRHHLGVAVSFTDGLTGFGGDLQFEHARTSADTASIQIKAKQISEDPTHPYAFSEGSTCARPVRGHECVVQPISKYPKEGSRWSYNARYRKSDHGLHRAAAHVANSAGIPTDFKITVGFSLEAEEYKAGWFAPEKYSTDVSL